MTAKRSRAEMTPKEIKKEVLGKKVEKTKTKRKKGAESIEKRRRGSSGGEFHNREERWDKLDREKIKLQHEIEELNRMKGEVSDEQFDQAIQEKIARIEKIEEEIESIKTVYDITDLTPEESEAMRSSEFRKSLGWPFADLHIEPTIKEGPAGKEREIPAEKRLYEQLSQSGSREKYLSKAEEAAKQIVEALGNLAKESMPAILEDLKHEVELRLIEIGSDEDYQKLEEALEKLSNEFRLRSSRGFAEEPEAGDFADQQAAIPQMIRLYGPAFSDGGKTINKNWPKKYGYPEGFYANDLIGMERSHKELDTELFGQGFVAKLFSKGKQNELAELGRKIELGKRMKKQRDQNAGSGRTIFQHSFSTNHAGKVLRHEMITLFKKALDEFEEGLKKGNK